jgi:hypothetical protein
MHVNSRIKALFPRRALLHGPLELLSRECIPSCRRLSLSLPLPFAPTVCLRCVPWMHNVNTIYRMLVYTPLLPCRGIYGQVTFVGFHGRWCLNQQSVASAQPA